MSIYRGEQYELTWAPEKTQNSGSPRWIDPKDGAFSTANITNVLGIINTANLPDPVYDWQPTWSYATNTYRNWYKMYIGKVEYRGAIPDIWLLDGSVLRLPIGTCDSVGTAQAANTTLSAAVEAGAVTISTAANSFSSGEYICIGGALTRKREIRLLTNSTSPYSFAVPLSYYHGNGEAVVKHTIVAGIPSYWIHTIYEAYDLSPITLAITNIKDDLSVGLERKYYSGKVGRATISASEGEELKMSLDEFIFRDIGFESPDVNASAVNKYAVQTRPAFTLPSTERYLFSGGSVFYDGATFARVKRVAVEINNNLVPEYFLNTDNLIQLPFELREGRREYTITITVALESDEVLMHLLNEGVPVDGVAYSGANRSGYEVYLTFVREYGANPFNDYIRLLFPWTGAAQVGAGTQGCFLRRAPTNIMTETSPITVDLDFIASSCQISMTDPNKYYYP